MPASKEEQIGEDFIEAIKDLTTSIENLTGECKSLKEEMRKTRNSMEGLDNTGQRLQDIGTRLGMAFEVAIQNLNVIHGIGSGVTALAKSLFQSKRRQ